MEQIKIEFTWPEQAVSKLKFMWENRRSAGQIARQLSHDFATVVGRSAVCNKLARMGLQSRTQSVWSDERVERLKALQIAGKSCAQIASELGEVSRNGVIGKLHRLGLSPGKEAQAFQSRAALGQRLATRAKKRAEHRAGKFTDARTSRAVRIQT